MKTDSVFLHIEFVWFFSTWYNSTGRHSSWEVVTCTDHNMSERAEHILSLSNLWTWGEGTALASRPLVDSFKLATLIIIKVGTKYHIANLIDGAFQPFVCKPKIISSVLCTDVLYSLQWKSQIREKLVGFIQLCYLWLSFISLSSWLIFAVNFPEFPAVQLQHLHCACLILLHLLNSPQILF